MSAIENQVKGILNRLDHLRSEIGNTAELHATPEEKIKLLNDIKRISMIQAQVRDLEVNETRFSDVRNETRKLFTKIRE